ncbi:MAG TPA: nuclear transport factor 2 family protein [Terriglobales bacterium]|nr:nuclear transport factor 2 family protein [Terriglobales bacterium]
MSKAEVEQVVKGIYSAFEALDARRLDDNFSHTEILTAFGTDEDEFFYGWEKYKSVHVVQFQAVKSFKFSSTDLRTYENGDTAWFSDRPHWQIETKAGEKVDTMVRITGVLRRHQGKWEVMQWHVSRGLARLHEY